MKIHNNCAASYRTAARITCQHQ